MVPLFEGGPHMPLGGIDRPSVDRHQMVQCTIATSTKLGQPEVCHLMAEAAQADDSHEALTPRRRVICPAFMGLKPLTCRRITFRAAYFAPVISPAVHHAPQQVPTSAINATADIGEPAGGRHKIHKKP
jgi:hypothetical protein